MRTLRKRTADPLTEQLMADSRGGSWPSLWDRFEKQVPNCAFGQMGLCCQACSQGPCRVDPFGQVEATSCGRTRTGLVASEFCRQVAQGAAAQLTHALRSGGEGGRGDPAPVLEAMEVAREGDRSPEDTLMAAVRAALAGTSALAMVPADGATARGKAGLAALRRDEPNVLLVGRFSAAPAALAAGRDAGVNVGAACGAEGEGRFRVAGDYGSQEVLVTSGVVDAVVAGEACVAPGLEKAAQAAGVPFFRGGPVDVAGVVRAAEGHFRRAAGRSSRPWPDGPEAVVGLGRVAREVLAGAAAVSGLRGVAWLGGCSNARVTHRGAILDQARALLSADVLVLASGCAGAALAAAGLLDPDRREHSVGRGLAEVLGRAQKATGLGLPPAWHLGTCWSDGHTLTLLADLIRAGVPVLASFPEASRPAAWATAVAAAARGIPTYLGPVLPLDGTREARDMLGRVLQEMGGKTLVGPGQVRKPEQVAAVLWDGEGA
ncbi:MAG: hypothetical protein AB1503_09225 [Bacillota bacterium]|nr:hypothetical protein [Bacillota bacterium]